MAPEPLTYTVAQLAQRLQISPRQIRRLREAGEFPFDPLPGIGAVRFSRLEVERRLTDVASLRIRAKQAAADENEPDRHLSGRLFPALATHADNSAWLDHLEACHGRVAFTVPTQPNGQVARIVREFGEFLEALDDGDAVDLEREGREAIQAIAGEMARRRELRERR